MTSAPTAEAGVIPSPQRREKGCPPPTTPAPTPHVVLKRQRGNLPPFKCFEAEPSWRMIGPCEEFDELEATEAHLIEQVRNGRRIMSGIGWEDRYESDTFIDPDYRSTGDRGDRAERRKRREQHLQTACNSEA